MSSTLIGPDFHKYSWETGVQREVNSLNHNSGVYRLHSVALTVVDGVDGPCCEKRAQKLREDVEGQHLPRQAAEGAHGERHGRVHVSP